MAANWFAKTIAFIFARFPFANALTLLMLLSERAERETYPPVNPKIIYTHMGIFVIVGAVMGMKYKRKEAALVYVGQLVYLGYIFYSTEKLGYSYWLRVRICIRMLGVASVYLMYAQKLGKQKSDDHLSKLGQSLCGAFLLLSTYILVNSPEDKNAFLRHIPGGQVALYVYILLLSASAISFFGGLFVYDMIQPVVALLLLSTVFIDADIEYWHKKRGIDFWIQIRLILDNVSIVLGLIFYLATRKRDVPKTNID